MPQAYAWYTAPARDRFEDAVRIRHSLFALGRRRNETVFEWRCELQRSSVRQICTRLRTQTITSPNSLSCSSYIARQLVKRDAHVNQKAVSSSSESCSKANLSQCEHVRGWDTPGIASKETGVSSASKKGLTDSFSS